MLEIKNLKKTFSGKRDPVLDNITLKVKKGEFCILLGNHGSGKSSLIKTILGEYKQDSGAIRLGEHDFSNMSAFSRARYLGAAMQDFTDSTIGEMTLLENMVLSCLRMRPPAARFLNSSAPEIYQRLKVLNLGLEKSLYKKMNMLSDGRRQIISTLMACTGKPDLLLLDEHDSALDSKTKNILMEYVVSMTEDLKVTTLMATHDLQDAVEYGDRIIIMHQGKIIDDISGGEKDLITKESLMRIFNKIRGDL